MVSLQVPGGLEQLTKEITKDCYVFGSSAASASTLRKSPGKLLVTEEDEEEPHPRTTSVLGLGLTCSTCGKVFEDRDHQAAHFKTDYHRFNVKRQQKGKPALTEDVLEAILREENELSSISGSGSEGESEGEEEVGCGAVSQGGRGKDHGSMVAFRYRPSEGLEDERDCVSFGVPRSVLFHWGWREGDEPDQEAREALSNLASSSGKWAVVMASGGHFAAAVFPSGKAAGPAAAKPFPHKTLHRYVVRAKAGGRQAAKDATGKKANSAGASLRRHNERALAEDIRRLLQETWREELEGCDRIFVSAPGVHNASTFFSGKDPIFDRGDVRVCRVPFACRRPTLKEACRVKRLLSTLHEVRDHGDGEAQAQVEAAATAGEGERAVDKNAEEEEVAEDENAEGPKDETELHEATREGDVARVSSLLEGGADPCEKDLRGRPPYLLAKTKEVRDAYRRFRAKVGEDKFDWRASGVPQALTAELEEQQRLKKKEKEAKRKKERQRRKKEQDEKRRAREREEGERAKAAAAAEPGRGGGQGGAQPFNRWGKQLTQRQILAKAAEARIRKMVSARNRQA